MENPRPAFILNPLIQNWEEKSLAFFRAQNWQPFQEPILIAISGGADSTALLHFWMQAAEPVFKGPVALAHIHHGLRKASDEEKKFVENLAKDYGLCFFGKDLNPINRAVGESTEMWARRERYQFFQEATESFILELKKNSTENTAKIKREPWILTAHHRDDLVETIFQRLGRGTGPKGLAGIPFRRHPNIIRPFLNRSRLEILTYLQAREKTWAEDASNVDLGIERNWYRHQFLPAYKNNSENKSEKNFTEEFDARILSFALQMQEMGAFLQHLEKEDAKKFLHWEEKHGLKIPSIPVNSLHEILEKDSSWDLSSVLTGLLSATFNDSSLPRIEPDLEYEFRRQWQGGKSHLQVRISDQHAFKVEDKALFVLKNPLNALQTEPKGELICPYPPQKVILLSTFQTENQGESSSEMSRAEIEKGEYSWCWENTISTMVETPSATSVWTLAWKRYPRPEKWAFPQKTELRAIFDANVFSSTLHIRMREMGDRFSPYGIRSRSRKLKIFLSEKKVPIGMRSKLPLILAGDTIAWVPGYGISDFFKVTETTSSFLELVIICQNQ